MVWPSTSTGSGRIAKKEMKRSLALATDLYELTMAAAHFSTHANAVATFELFVRNLPPDRRYLIVAGLDSALEYLEGLQFTDEEIAYLRNHPVFRTVSDAFFDYLSRLRFTGEVWAIPEGTPAFQNEPLLRVTAPVVEAQLVETFLLSTVNFQTMIASKVTRIVNAAGQRRVVEFGSRRAHGSEAALYAARAAYLAGCDGTSNVEAGLRFGIPTFGTIAHSWVMCFEKEIEAFQRYMALFPEATTLLIDTYDTLAAAAKVVAAGLRPQAVRLDSGDLAELSREVRRILDKGGLRETQIFVSGDLDEWQIAALVGLGVPVDAFGVGTRLATSFDQPALGGVYKLVELLVDGKRRPTAKTSEGKATFPGRKQVWRCMGLSGEYTEDFVAATGEAGPERAEALLTCVMRNGERLETPRSLSDVRACSRDKVERLPANLRTLENGQEYPVRISDCLVAEQRVVAALGRT